MTFDEALRWIYSFADLERGVGHAVGRPMRRDRRGHAGC